MLDVFCEVEKHMVGNCFIGIIFDDLMLCQIISFAELLVGRAFLLCRCERSLMV